MDRTDWSLLLLSASVFVLVAAYSFCIVWTCIKVM